MEVVTDYVNYQYQGEKVINSSVTKKGANNTFTYTHEVVVEKKGKQVNTKKNITAGEYFDLLSFKDPER